MSFHRVIPMSFQIIAIHIQVISPGHIHFKSLPVISISMFLLWPACKNSWQQNSCGIKFLFNWNRRNHRNNMVNHFFFKKSKNILPTAGAARFIMEQKYLDNVNETSFNKCPSPTRAEIKTRKQQIGVFNFLSSVIKCPPQTRAEIKTGKKTN